MPTHAETNADLVRAVPGLVRQRGRYALAIELGPVIPGHMQRPDRFARGDVPGERVDIHAVWLTSTEGAACWPGRRLLPSAASMMQVLVRIPRVPDSAALGRAMIGIHWRGTYNRRIGGALAPM